MKTVHECDRTFDAAVHALRLRVLEMARDAEADSDVLAAAFADVLATVMIVQDQTLGRRQIEDRLGSFLGRVEETYARMAGRSLPAMVH